MEVFSFKGGSMKKKIKIIIILVLIVLLGVFLFNKLKVHHLIKYNINKSIRVEEEYVKDKKNDYYLFTVSIGDKSFIFDTNNKFNKKRKVLKDIKVFEEDELVCIYPMLIDSTYLDIQCNINNKLYSYVSIKDKYNLSDFVAINKNYDDNLYNNNINNTFKEKDITVYKDNLYDNEDILIYNYKDLIKTTNNGSSSIVFSNYDIYSNKLGVLVDNYYLIPKYTKKAEIDTYYFINVVSNNKKEVKLRNKLSTNVYINGIVDDKLYIFDKSNIRQYEINPKNNKIKMVGDKNSIKYYNGSWMDYNPYSYVKDEKSFEIDDGALKTNYEKLLDGGNCYYFYNSKGEFYKVYKNDLSKYIYLFKYNSFKEVNIFNNKLYFIDNMTLYRWDQFGIKAILKRNEFKYNYKRIYSVYFE